MKHKIKRFFFVHRRTNKKRGGMCDDRYEHFLHTERARSLLHFATLTPVQFTVHDKHVFTNDAESTQR